MPILDLTDKNKVKEYDKFIETSPYGHMMQSRGWSDVKNNWEHDYVYLEDAEGKINAALSIISVKNDGKNAFLYAPRGPVCDPKDLDLVNELIKEAEPVVKKRNGFLLRLDPEVDYSEKLVEAYQNAGFKVNPSFDDASEGSHTNPPYNMILKLDDMDEEDVFASYKGKHRTAIRKTYKEGLYTIIHDKNDDDFLEALEKLNELMQGVAERENISLRNLEYLTRLSNAFEDIKIFETKHPEGEVLASGLVVTYNKKSFYIYAGSSNSHRKLNASTQMNQEAIEYALEKGSLEYDMGGIFSTESTDGLYRFKKEFCRKDDYSRFLGELDVVYDEEAYQEFIK